jgi:hypothetical protein
MFDYEAGDFEHSPLIPAKAGIQRKELGRRYRGGG